MLRNGQARLDNRKRRTSASNKKSLSSQLETSQTFAMEKIKTLTLYLLERYKQRKLKNLLISIKYNTLKRVLKLAKMQNKPCITLWSKHTKVKLPQVTGLHLHLVKDLSLLQHRHDYNPLFSLSLTKIISAERKVSAVDETRNKLCLSFPKKIIL